MSDTKPPSSYFVMVAPGAHPQGAAAERLRETYDRVVAFLHDRVG